MDIKRVLNTIDKKKKKLDSYRPLDKNVLENLKEDLIVGWTYNSNAIEGNTLTLTETKVVLEGITVGGKTLREHLEVVNHKEAILFIEDIIRKEEELNEWMIKSIHSLVMKGIADKNPGFYRESNVLISGARHRPPEHFLVSQAMKDLMDWYHGKGQPLHPVERATKLHGIFVGIHPFLDGNGRTVRLLLNFELMREGYVPIIIRKEDRLEYYEVLDKAQVEKDYNKFIRFVAEREVRMLDFYLDFVK